MEIGKAISIEIIGFEGFESSVGWVECRFFDAWQKEHLFIEKIPIVTKKWLDESSDYPQEGIIACELIKSWTDEKNRTLYTVTTERPWNIETYEGVHEFDIIEEQLNDYESKPSKSDSSEWLLGQGLEYYCSDDDEDFHLNLALEKFLEAYEIDPDNYWACLFIGHCYYHKGELENALQYYERVDRKALKAFQTWRYVKLIEQIGYCNYQLGRKELGRQQFQEVLAWYRKLTQDDDLAAPTELLQCLPESDEIVIEIKKMEDYLD